MGLLSGSTGRNVWRDQNCMNFIMELCLKLFLQEILRSTLYFGEDILSTSARDILSNREMDSP